MPEAKKLTCAYCQAVFADHAGRYDNLVPGQLVLRQCDECHRLDAEGKLNSLGKLQYESPFTAAAAWIMYFSCTMTIGDVRGSPDHWSVDAHAKVAYAAMIFPPAILWSCAQKSGKWLLLIIGLLLAGYPFLANHLLGYGAHLFENTRRGISPASGAFFVWLAAGAVLVAVWHIFEGEERYEPNKIRYERTAGGFIKAYLIAAALIYLAGLAIGYWKQGDYGLSLQVTAGMWRALFLAVPLAYFFWTFLNPLRMHISKASAKKS
jgi:hypothetical protein